VWPDEDGEEMTIGIGVLCDEGRCAILASDMRASWPDGDKVDPNDRVGKQFGFPGVPGFDKVVCAIAGRLGVSHDVVSQLTVEFRKVSRHKNIFREHIQNAIDYARAHELRRRYSWALEANLGISLSQLLRGKLPSGPLDPVAMAEARRIMAGTEFRIELIIAGFMGSEPLLFKASQKLDIQGESDPPIHVIGSAGKAHALAHLNKRQQNTGCNIARSLLHVYEALEIARINDSKYVGIPSWYAVIFPDSGVWRVPSGSPLLREWAKAYKERADTWSLQGELPNKQAMHLLLKWEGHEGR
jgi:hypothetical protein